MVEPAPLHFNHTSLFAFFFLLVLHSMKSFTMRERERERERENGGIGKEFICPILVIRVLQFESQYICKRNSLKVYTSRV